MPLIIKDMGFEWPNGQIVYQNLNFSLEDKTYAMVGPNGIGKSTLCRLIVGDLQPTKGLLRRTHGTQVALFSQFESRPPCSILDYLGQNGSYALRSLLLVGLDENRVCTSLSGGEWTRVRLAKVALSGCNFVVLDEPTNHLDREGRQAVQEFIHHFRGGILFITHDRELLERAEKILEMSSHGVKLYGGNWREFSEYRQKENLRLSENLEVSKRERHKAQVERREKIQRQDKRQRQGKKKAEKGGMPKIIIGGLKRKAQVTQGKIDRSTLQDVDESVQRAWEDFKHLKVDPLMYARLPAIDPPIGKIIVEADQFNFRFKDSNKNLWAHDLNFCWRGAARVAISGANGSGKSTLLRLLSQKNILGERKGRLRLGPVRPAFLDQEPFQSNQSVLARIRQNVSLEEAELRNLLAMFLFPGEKVHQYLSQLSGGERLRLALAEKLLATPGPQVLILDEPTNNLDFPNIEFLERLLKSFKGALIVVSHDQRFLAQLDLEQELVLQK